VNPTKSVKNIFFFTPNSKERILNYIKFIFRTIKIFFFYGDTIVMIILIIVMQNNLIFIHVNFCNMKKIFV